MCRALVVSNLGEGRYQVQRAPMVDHAQFKINSLQYQINKIQTEVLPSLLTSKNDAEAAMIASGSSLDAAILAYSNAVNSNSDAQILLESLKSQIEDQEETIEDLQQEFDDAEQVFHTAESDLATATEQYNNGEITSEELAIYQALRDVAYSNYLNASGRLGAAQGTLDDLEAQRDAVVITDLAPLYSAMEKAAADYQGKQLDYGRANTLYQNANLKIVSFQKQLSLVLAERAAIEKTFEAWCADLSEGLSGHVATAEVNGLTNHVIIRPGYTDRAVFNGSRDGSLAPVKLLTPAATAFNWAVHSGWQKWKPTYRLGTLTAIAEDGTCTVDLDPVLQTPLRLDVNQSDTLSNVPITYMSCDGAAFEADDRVLVELTGQEWSNARVIGFESEPKACPNKFLCIFEDHDHTYQYIFNPVTLQFEFVTSIAKALSMTPQSGVYPYCSAFQYAEVSSDTFQELRWVQKYGDAPVSDVYSRITCMSCSCIYNPELVWSIVSSPLDETVVIRLVNRETMAQVFEYKLHGGLSISTWVRCGKITRIESEPGCYLLERVYTSNTEYSGVYQVHKINTVTGAFTFVSSEAFTYDGTGDGLNWYLQSFMGAAYRLFDVVDVFGSGDWEPAGYSDSITPWDSEWSGYNPCVFTEEKQYHRNMEFFGVVGSYEVLLTDQSVPRDPDHLVRDGWDRYYSVLKGPIDYSNNITFAAGGLSAFSPLWPIPGYIEGGELVDTVETYNEYPVQPGEDEVPWSCPPPSVLSSALTDKTGTEIFTGTVKLPFFQDIGLQNDTATYHGPVLPGGYPDVTHSSTNGSGWPFFSLAVGATIAILAIHWTENDPVEYPEKVQLFRKIRTGGQDWEDAEWIEITSSVSFPSTLLAKNFMGLFTY